MKTHYLIAVILFFFSYSISAQSSRQKISFNDGWKFSLGDASSYEKDFRNGTEYFNYLTKANSIHNEGPYSQKFSDSLWQDVKIPHDWVTQLPFDKNASHSHGYRAIGYKYPQNSVGWYRKTLKIGKEDEGKNLSLEFDGIFRNATLWVNGFYMGTEPSGYASQVYDITDYINYGGDNLVTVRADASLEEGWFYEGAGIYRDVYICKSEKLHVAPYGTFIYSELKDNYTNATLFIETDIKNSDIKGKKGYIYNIIRDMDGKEIARTNSSAPTDILAKEIIKIKQQCSITKPKLWSCENPYLYSVETVVMDGDKVADSYITTTGIREARFDKEKGFLLNGRQVKLKGVNMHQDHAGVGAAIPDALQAYRIERLKSFGCNAYRASHNPMTPALLDICDKKGILVIDENRLMGVNDEHLRLLERLVKRDRNHPSVILWSNGNEEWGLENNIQGIRVAASMREYTHRLDPTRLTTVANAGGNQMIQSLDVVGYNYIAQNDVEGLHKKNPEWIACGTEETTGCGTRGVYFDNIDKGHMKSLNMQEHSKTINVIERGWKFYDERPWLAGLFYWTGFDYRGEPNPLKYPAVGSEFGILDYCGFEKDEAYYLKSWWTNEPVLHIFPHWNLEGHEGEEVEIWAYSNMDEVELIVNGKKLERKSMPKNGHLSWKAIYQPGKVKAIGYKNGRKAQEETIYTAGTPASIKVNADRTNIKADNQDVAVLTVSTYDKKGRFVPTACEEIDIEITGEGRILGVGNGDPANLDPEQPAKADCKSFKVKTFNGLAQIIIQSSYKKGEISVSCRNSSSLLNKCTIFSE